MKHRENKQFAVGRAGHDPATYGLKGRTTKCVPAWDSSDVVTEPIYRDPTVVQAQLRRLPGKTLYWPKAEPAAWSAS